MRDLSGDRVAGVYRAVVAIVDHRSSTGGWITALDTPVVVWYMHANSRSQFTRVSQTVLTAILYSTEEKIISVWYCGTTVHFARSCQGSLSMHREDHEGSGLRSIALSR